MAAFLLFSTCWVRRLFACVQKRAVLQCRWVLNRKGELEKVSRYTIGLDYGTLSGRAVLADAADGRVLATAVYE